MSNESLSMWQVFAEQEQLNSDQVKIFQEYDSFLRASNDLFNLTAITETKSIINYHFKDSLAVRRFYDLEKVSLLADIGTGAGFPAIPLKIVFPQLKLLLIEVSAKKREFLQMLCDRLGLDGVELCDLDWRTFLRKTSYPVDLFVTRAALDEREFCRSFKSASPYKQVPIIYWASIDWECDPLVVVHQKRVERYKVGHKHRKLVFFQG